MSEPIPSAASTALVAIFRAADSLRRYLNQRLAPHDLTLQQYNVLRILRGAGGELPTMEIRERMMEHSPGITRIVDTLVAKGLLERRPEAGDRRRVLCCLTDEGAEKLTGLDSLMNAADLMALAPLSRVRLDELGRDLQAIAEATRAG